MIARMMLVVLLSLVYAIIGDVAVDWLYDRWMRR